MLTKLDYIMHMTNALNALKLKLKISKLDYIKKFNKCLPAVM